MKFLFLLKSNESYGSWNSKAGLTNSSSFLCDALETNYDVECDVRTVIDGNGIDKEVHNYKPDVCFIEAIWVEPKKWAELAKLHPNVQFIIRVHSRTPFLASEGIAMDWLIQYASNPNVRVSFNNEDTNTEYKDLLNPIYLPNAYDEKALFGKVPPPSPSLIFGSHKLHHQRSTTDIGCFGAIRPLKNQLEQAIAAIRFGNKYSKKVRFHINSERIEDNGNNILKNMRALFKATKHELVEYEWMERKEFLDVIGNMDVGLQVSFTESFNIVTADFIAQHVPCIVSPEITWMPKELKVRVSDSEEMADKIKEVLENRTKFVRTSLTHLKNYHNKAMEVWGNFIREEQIYGDDQG